MKRLIVSLLMLFPSIVLAESVVVLTQQGTSTQVIAATACNVSINTGWMLTNTAGSIALDVELDWTAATDYRMTCATCRTVTGGVCQDTVTKKVPVIVSTDAAGISTVIGSTWLEDVSADTGTGLVVSNAYAKWTRCAFICTGGGVNDKLSVWVRTVTP